MSEADALGRGAADAMGSGGTPDEAAADMSPEGRKAAKKAARKAAKKAERKAAKKTARKAARKAAKKAARKAAKKADAQDMLGPPSLVAQDVQVTYRVVGSRPGKPRRPGAGRTVGAPRRWKMARRLTTFGRSHAGGGVSEVHAVRGVSFVAHHGESIAIMGTNGSGKSSLLRALAGLQPLSGGSVYVSGTPSLLGVNAVLIKKLSGIRNIIIGGLALGLSRPEIESKVDEIVEFAGIGDAVHLPMATMSSGMAARLRFAISTARVPDVLMIDEALATGDAAFKARSKERIEEIRQEAGTIFFVSHSLSSVRAMCTRAIWIDQGQVRMDGPVDDVADAYHAYIRSDATLLRKERNRKKREKLGAEEWQRRRAARKARRAELKDDDGEKRQR